LNYRKKKKDKRGRKDTSEKFPVAIKRGGGEKLEGEGSKKRGGTGRVAIFLLFFRFYLIPSGSSDKERKGKKNGKAGCIFF